MKTFFLFLGLAGAAGSMHASPITFVATGALVDGATLSGFVVIDTATGVVQSANLSVSSPISISGLTLEAGFTSQGTADYTIEANLGGNPAELIILQIPVTTLVGYTGGNICLSGCVGNVGSGDASFAESTSNRSSAFSSGSLTAAPEPGSLALCLAGGALLAWKRRLIKNLVRRDRGVFSANDSEGL